MNQQEFTEAYKPSQAYVMALNEMECHNGTLSLRMATSEYSLEVVGNWVDSLVMDFVNFAMLKCSFTLEQRKDLAMTIIVSHQRMLCSELLLFFFKAKSGLFGKFYGTLEPMDITTRLLDWSQMCSALRNEVAAQAFDKYKESMRTGEIDYKAEFDRSIFHYGADGILNLTIK